MNGDLLSNQITPGEEVKAEIVLASEENRIALVLSQRGKIQIEIFLSEEEVLSLKEDILWALKRTKQT